MINTLHEQMRLQTNDYSDIEDVFRIDTGLNLAKISRDTSAIKSLQTNESVSVIIPSYNGHSTITKMLSNLVHQTFQGFEVVIVDDGSDQPIEDAVEVDDRARFPLKIVRQNVNEGRSYTRNTGLLAAEGTTVVFVDDDIMFDSDFIAHHAIRQARTDGCLFLGFKETINIDDIGEGYDRAPDYKKDWRYSIKVDGNFWSYNVHDLTPPPEQRSYKLLDETDYFKRLGYGAMIGYWDLAATASSHSMSVKRVDALRVGGFPEHKFDGWGFEDNAFGAKLIGDGKYVVPCLDTTYFHVHHPESSAAIARRHSAMGPNTQAYRNLLNSPAGS